MDTDVDIGTGVALQQSHLTIRLEKKHPPPRCNKMLR
jgi:hypothetical protein